MFGSPRLAAPTVALLLVIVPSALAQDPRLQISAQRQPSRPPHGKPPPHRRRRPPSQAKIRAAIEGAKHSRGLWATVNVCDTGRYPNTIGIRGEMPALGFRTELSMRIQVEYWSASRRRFNRDPYASTVVRLGTAARGFYQGGVMYRFSQRLLLRAAVTFRWRYRDRLLARVTRLTRGGVRHVDYGDPPGYSHATCRIS
jgi:hypothetical protein